MTDGPTAGPGTGLPSSADVLSALREAVDAGAALARAAFERRSFDVRVKADGTPVTSTDVEVERRMVEMLAARLPDLPVVGEEKTGDAGEDPDTYIALDPIDGTSNFLRGVPFFGLTAVYIERRSPKVGVVADPVHGRVCWAVRGAGAYRDGEPLAIEDGRTRLRGSTIALAAESLPPELQDRFLREVLRRVNRQQAIRSVALEIAGLASGWIDAAVFTDVSIWDFAAAALIVEEARGHWTSIDGERPDLNDPRASYSFVGAASRDLHAEILDLIRRSRAH